MNNKLILLLVIGLLLVPVAVAADTGINNGLVSHWTGDGTANDIAGPDNGVVAGPVSYVSGVYGQAFYLDGNDYVSVPFKQDYSFNPGDSFTISAWVKPEVTDLSGAHAILVKSPASNVWDWGLYLYDGTFMTGRHNQNVVLSTTSPEAENWYMATATYNGSTGALKLYVDGMLEGETTGFAITASRGGLGIGVKGDAAGMDHFTGAIDDVRIYNRELSAAEIADLYGQTSGPADDTTVRAVSAVAAVAAGTVLGFLGLFMNRFSDFPGRAFGRIAAWLKAVWAVFNKLVPIDTLFDFVQGYVKSYLKSLFFKEESRFEEPHARQQVSFLAGFSRPELAVIVLTSVLLGIAYLASRRMDLLSPGLLVLYILVAGFATLLHDLTHRYVAWRYQAVTEFQLWGFGTVIMLATAFLFGVVYGVPARTLINEPGKMGPRKQAIIFLAGPGVSFLLAAAFLMLLPFGGGIGEIGLLGASMNLLTAVYSLMPFDPMDGSKVLKWKGLIWAAMFIPMLLLYMGLTIYVF